MLKLRNSKVIHKTWVPLMSTPTYVEGLENNAIGYVNDGVWYVRFTNSYGNSEAYAGGTYKQYGNWMIATGEAYGYEEFPQGRPVAGFIRIVPSKQKLKLSIPASKREYLQIEVEYEEIDSYALHK